MLHSTTFVWNIKFSCPTDFPHPVPCTLYRSTEVWSSKDPLQHAWHGHLCCKSLSDLMRWIQTRYSIYMCHWYIIITLWLFSCLLVMFKFRVLLISTSHALYIDLQRFEVVFNMHGMAICAVFLSDLLRWIRTQLWDIVYRHVVYIHVNCTSILIWKHGLLKVDSQLGVLKV